MRADAPRLAGWRPPTVTTTRLVWIAAAAAVVLASGLFSRGLWLIPAYATLVLATAWAVRSVGEEPGSWLGRRAIRRGLVAGIAAVCALLVAGTFWPPVAGAFVVLLIVLILLDVALGRATQRLATAPDEVVDERQEWLRNRAHRLAYWLFAALVGGTLFVTTSAGPQSRSWLDGALIGGGTIVILQLLFVLPAMVLAWLEPDRLAPEARPARDIRAPLALGLLALTIATPFLLSTGVAVLPVRTTSWVSPQTFGAAPRQCREFMASATAGFGVEARIPLHATACWDGRTATGAWGLNASDCHLASAVMATDATARCTRETGPDGTLHFTYVATVTPVLLPFLHRDVAVSLVLDRDGRVERLP